VSSEERLRRKEPGPCPHNRLITNDHAIARAAREGSKLNAYCDMCMDTADVNLGDYEGE
jgi:hypothetical protein